jgi:hypothetical protein
MATKADLEAIEQRMATDFDAFEHRMATDFDAFEHRMATDLANAVERLDESIKSRKEDENALYRIVEDHERRIRRLEPKAL